MADIIVKTNTVYENISLSMIPKKIKEVDYNRAMYGTMIESGHSSKNHKTSTL